MNSIGCRKNRIDIFDVVRISKLRFRSELCSHCKASKKEAKKEDRNGRENASREASVGRKSYTIRSFRDERNEYFCYTE